MTLLARSQSISHIFESQDQEEKRDPMPYAPINVRPQGGWGEAKHWRGFDSNCLPSVGTFDHFGGLSN